MAKKTSKQTVTIDEVEYKLDDLSANAKKQLTNIQFVDFQLQQLRNELAVSDTARIAYTNALKNDLDKIKDSE